MPNIWAETKQLSGRAAREAFFYEPNRTWALEHVSPLPATLLEIQIINTEQMLRRRVHGAPNIPGASDGRGRSHRICNGPMEGYGNLRRLRALIQSCAHDVLFCLLYRMSGDRTRKEA